jgi:hypothetical protein
MLRSVVFQTGSFWSSASDSERFTSASFAASAPIATNDGSSLRTPRIPRLIPGSVLILWCFVFLPDSRDHKADEKTSD